MSVTCQLHAQVRVLKKAQQWAAENQEFAEAIRYRDAIAELGKVGERAAKLEVQMKTAADSEEYESAMRIKKTLDEMRKKITGGNAATATAAAPSSGGSTTAAAPPFGAAAAGTASAPSDGAPSIPGSLPSVDGCDIGIVSQVERLQYLQRSATQTQDYKMAIHWSKTTEFLLQTGRDEHELEAEKKRAIKDHDDKMVSHIEEHLVFIKGWRRELDNILSSTRNGAAAGVREGSVNAGSDVADTPGVLLRWKKLAQGTFSADLCISLMKNDDCRARILMHRTQTPEDLCQLLEMTMEDPELEWRGMWLQIDGKVESQIAKYTGDQIRLIKKAYDSIKRQYPAGLAESLEAGAG